MTAVKLFCRNPYTVDHYYTFNIHLHIKYKPEIWGYTHHHKNDLSLLPALIRRSAVVKVCNRRLHIEKCNQPFWALLIGLDNPY